MAKTKEEMKQELNDAKIYLKEGIERINEEQRIKNIEKNAKVEKIQNWSQNSWDKMSEKPLKRYNKS